MLENEYLNFDIYEVCTIVKKCETGVFDFQNVCREWDGFVFFVEGSASLLFSGKFYKNVCAGELVLLKKGDNYGFYAENGCSYITSAFFFTEDSKESVCSLPRVIKCSSELSAKIFEMKDIWEKRLFESNMFCKIQLLSLYLEIAKLEKYRKAFDNDFAVTQALEFIHNNFKRNFSNEEISRYCSMSGSYLRSKFLKCVGVTITEYRDGLRLKAAKELLTGRVFSVKETALELGFCDVYHFSKFFAKHTGISPAKYAKDFFVRK